MAERKLDIFKTLTAISRKNPEFYRHLSDEEKSGFQPLVVMRWLSGINSPQQVVLLNEFVNQFVFPLQKHKELLFDLMTICTNGNNQKYQWKKVKATSDKYPLSVQAIKQYYQYSMKDAREVLPILSNQAIMSFAEQLGFSSEEIKKLEKELKNRT